MKIDNPYMHKIISKVKEYFPLLGDMQMVVNDTGITFSLNGVTLEFNDDAKIVGAQASSNI